MKKWFDNHKFYFIGAILGAVGYIYWKYVGCSSGTCAITSKSVNSSLYGALMGSLLLSMFKKENKAVKE
jgi:hypothetical protein